MNDQEFLKLKLKHKFIVKKNKKRLDELKAEIEEIEKESKPVFDKLVYDYGYCPYHKCFTADHVHDVLGLEPSYENCECGTVWA